MVSGAVVLLCGALLLRRLTCVLLCVWSGCRMCGCWVLHCCQGAQEHTKQLDASVEALRSTQASKQQPDQSRH
jgi:hypothetical protein